MLKINYLCFLIIVFFTLNASAASLSHLKVNSYLNQPLAAEIQVFTEKEYPLEYIRVDHASRDAYKKFGIEKNSYTNDIELILISDNSGKLRVKINSKKAIKDPLVSLVLTLSWPEGNLSKEYNFFLSPTEYSPTKVKTYVNKSVNKQSQNKPKKQPQKLAATRKPTKTVESQELNKAKALSLSKAKLTKFKPKSTNKKATSKLNKATNLNLPKPPVYRPDLVFDLADYEPKQLYGPITYGNSITLVAQSLREDESFSVQKISKLLYQLNPTAFFNDDIHRLKSGSMIKVPQLSNPALKKDEFLPANKRRTNLQQSSQEKSKAVSKLSLLPPSLDEEELMQLAQKTVVQDSTKYKAVSNRVVAESEMVSNDLEETVNVSNEKLSFLTEENKLLKKQFDILMLRMEQVIQKNNNLDEKLKQASDKPEQTAQLVGELNKSDEKIASAVSNDSEGNENKITASKKEMNVTPNVDKNPIANTSESQASQTMTQSTSKTKELSIIDQLFSFISSYLEIIIASLVAIILLLWGFIKRQAITDKFSKKESGSEDFDLENAFAEQKSTSFDSLMEDVQMKNHGDEPNAKSVDAHDSFIQETINHDDMMDEISFDTASDANTDSDDIFVSAVQSAKPSKTIPQDNATLEKAPKDDLDSIMSEAAAIDAGENIEPVKEMSIDDVQFDADDFGAEDFDADSMEEISLDVAAPIDEDISLGHNVEMFDESFSEPESTENSSGLMSSNLQHNEAPVEDVQVSSVQAMSDSTDNAPNFSGILGTSKPKSEKSDVDVLSQASVYFAYGKFDLAESLIKEAVEQDNDNSALRLKLFECYSKKDDEESFLLTLGESKAFYESDPEFKAKIEKFYESRWNKSLF